MEVDEMVQYARAGAIRVPDHGPAPNVMCMLHACFLLFVLTRTRYLLTYLLVIPPTWHTTIASTLSRRPAPLSCCPPSASRLTPMDGGWRRWAGVCSEVRKRVYTCGVSQ